jgi:rhomboid-like protein
MLPLRLRCRLSCTVKPGVVLARVHVQARNYARGRFAIRQIPKSRAEREVLIDPFKRPETPPKPDYRTLVRPAVFALIVLGSGDLVADYFVSQRTSQATTRAERQAETAWTIWPIIGVNVAVFVLWRAFPSLVYKLGGILTPYAPSPAQLIGNTFSHQDLWHLGFNQIAFYSLGSLVCDTVGREHFLSLYLSAACVSSLASAAATQFFVARGFFAPEHLVRGSLGASGVIYSMFAIATMTYPDLKIGVIFLPLYFSIKYAFPAFCALDITGILAKWSRFDHVCHVSSPSFALS